MPLPYQQLGVIVVGVSLAVWWPAFTLGAWGEIFFDNLLTVWAATTAAFIVVVLVPGARKRLGWRLLTLLLPSFWLVINIAVPADGGNLALALVALLGIGVILLGIPFTMWVLARVVWPDLSDEVPARGKLLVVFAVLLIAAGSFALGANESKFLTCEDFTVSGNSEPPGCVHADAPVSFLPPATLESSPAATR
ncbi:hypothetical protein KPL76_05340 [Subtercola sp. PAMC28395]|nr:hypothetical protein KPL76_05340 [Subtercola sp. PAMC28395]